uniref:Uncharacterized protein n=1 Tax=Oryza sativa subsp. japonica TaxID=39947 RepID=Q67VG5_ORYSJ|nr:hypothetical protein [Oryza sativa Japonica Group]
MHRRIMIWPSPMGGYFLIRVGPRPQRERGQRALPIHHQSVPSPAPTVLTTPRHRRIVYADRPQLLQEGTTDVVVRLRVVVT